MSIYLKCVVIIELRLFGQQYLIAHYHSILAIQIIKIKYGTSTEYILPFKIKIDLIDAMVFSYRLSKQ